MQVHDEVRSETPKRDKYRRLVRNALTLVLIALLTYVIIELLHEDYSSQHAFGFTAIGIWAFGITGLIIGHLCLPSTQHRVKKLTILFLVYVGSYAYFTSTGSYYFSQTGNVRYSSGLSMSDVSIWHPKLLYWQLFQDTYGQSTSRGTTFGYYYSPLILVDRQWIHQTQQLLASELTEEEPTE